jgi:hypothetical protein
MSKFWFDGSARESRDVIGRVGSWFGDGHMYVIAFKKR